MAESTTSSSGSANVTAREVTPTSKQFIKASVDDNALEPDALRGSEHLVRDLKIQDDEADRRKVYEKKEDK